MRKWTLLSMLLGLMLTLMVGSAQATLIDERPRLAEYYPEDTLAYLTMRTDAGYIETLDAVLGQVNENIGGDIIPPDLSVADLLDFATLNFLGTDFDSSIGAWLGDQAAIGLLSLDMTHNEPDALAAIEVTDRTAAVEFLGAAFPSWTATDEDDYTLFKTSGMDVGLVSNDVMLIGNQTQRAYEGYEVSLAEADSLHTVTATLPADNYNIFAYLNSVEINTQSAAMMEAQMEMLGFELPAEIADLMTAGSPTSYSGFGFTILDGRSLVLDVVSVAEQQGLNSALAGADVKQDPVNLDFAAHIPSNAQFVMLDNGLSTDFQSVIELLNLLAPLANELIHLSVDIAVDFGDSNNMDEKEQMALDLLNMINISGINVGGILVNYVNQLYAGFTGLNFQKEVIGWMSGDYSLHLSLINVESDLIISLDGGMNVENTNPEAAAYMLERLTQAANLYRLENNTESIGNGQALVVPALLRAIAPLLVDDPEIVINTPELDFLVGLDDKILTSASRPSAEAALNPTEGETLLNQEAFSYAVDNLILEDSILVWYIGLPPLVKTLHSMDTLIPQQELNQIVFALGQVESLTMSGNLPSNEAMMIRFTVTLPTEPPVLSSTTGIVSSETLARYINVPQDITEEGFPVLGDLDAPIVVEGYLSFGCPHCFNFNQQAMDTLIEMTSAGEIAYIYKPIAAGPMDNIPAANNAAMCVVASDVFWPYHDTLYSMQETHTAFIDGDLIEMAMELGVDSEALAACLSTEGTALSDLALTQFREAGGTGTPTFVVNDERVDGGSLEALLAAIEQAGS